MDDKKEIKEYQLSPEEVEKLLQAQYGGKLEPVDKVKLAKHKLQARFKNNLPAKKKSIL